MTQDRHQKTPTFCGVTCHHRTQRSHSSSHLTPLLLLCSQASATSLSSWASVGFLPVRKSIFLPLLAIAALPIFSSQKFTEPPRVLCVHVFFSAGCSGLSSPLKGEETYNQGKKQTRQFILSCFAGGVPDAGCAKLRPDIKVRDPELAERLDTGTIS